jgi:hypothetical protein
MMTFVVETPMPVAIIRIDDYGAEERHAQVTWMPITNRLPYSAWNASDPRGGDHHSLCFYEQL